MKKLCVFAFIALLTQSTFAFAKEENKSWFNLKSMLPNSVSYELTNDDVSIKLKDRPTLKVKTKEFSSDLGEVSRVASKITIKQIPDIKGKQGFHLLWSPMLSLAFYNFEVDSKSVFFPQTTFQFFRVMAGFGPELRYVHDIGIISLQVAPAATYSWVSWSSPVSGGSFAKSNFNIGATLNYIKPFAENWNFQIVSRYIYEDKDVWEEALSSSQGFKVPVKSVENTMIGIAVGYHW